MASEPGIHMRVLEPLVDSLLGDDGKGFVVSGGPGSGKTRALRWLRSMLVPAEPLPSDPPLVRWGRERLEGRRFVVCDIGLKEWENSTLSLQAAIASHLALQAPRLSLPLSTVFLASPSFPRALLEQELHGVILLADDLDCILGGTQRPRRDEDIAFLDELGGILSVYMPPLWVVFTMTMMPPRLKSSLARRALRDRYTWLLLSGLS